MASAGEAGVVARECERLRGRKRAAAATGGGGGERASGSEASAMNKAFTEVAQLARIKGPALTHQQRATRLYRRSLKSLLSWAIDREVFYEEAYKIRARFDSVKSVAAGKHAVEAGEAELWECLHPDPWCMNYMPGGTKFMRNPVPHTSLVYPDGEVPADAETGTRTPVWPDMVPITFRPKQDGGLIDFAKKNME